MSLITCDHCGEIIDTDDDPESQHCDPLLAICQTCREMPEEEILKMECKA